MLFSGDSLWGSKPRTELFGFSLVFVALEDLTYPASDGSPTPNYILRMVTSTPMPCPPTSPLPLLPPPSLAIWRNWPTLWHPRTPPPLPLEKMDHKRGRAAQLKESSSQHVLRVGSVGTSKIGHTQVKHSRNFLQFWPTDRLYFQDPEPPFCWNHAWVSIIVNPRLP